MIQLYLCSYELSSGYKPAPLDLSHIKLTSTQEAMVDKLAENAHNVWARDRIRQGWTYGIQQVGVSCCEMLGTVFVCGFVFVLRQTDMTLCFQIVEEQIHRMAAVVCFRGL